VRVNLPRDTTPVRALSRCLMRPRFKSSALNPGPQSERSPCFALFHPIAERGPVPRFKNPNHDQHLPSCSLWPANLGLASRAGLGLSLIGPTASATHRLAPFANGASGHRLLGLDHLLLLVGARLRASFISSTLLLYALGRRCVGSLFGLSGGQLPWTELARPLAVSLLGLTDPAQPRQAGDRPPPLRLVVYGSVAVHAMLHGIEASGAKQLVAGCFLASTWCCSSYGCLRKSAQWNPAARWTASACGGSSPCPDRGRCGPSVTALTGLGSATIGTNFAADPGYSLETKTPETWLNFCSLTGRLRPVLASPWLTTTPILTKQLRSGLMQAFFLFRFPIRSSIAPA